MSNQKTLDISSLGDSFTLDTLAEKFDESEQKLGPQVIIMTQRQLEHFLWLIFPLDQDIRFRGVLCQTKKS